MEEQHEDHGHSVAAWTGVGVILLGVAVASAAMLIPNVPLFIVGMVICAVGLVVGKVLSMAGYGAAPHASQASGVADAPDEVTSSTLGKS